MAEVLIATDARGIRTVSINREEKRNALDRATCSELEAAFVEAHADSARPAPDDLAVVRDGVTLLVDQISLMYLAGSEIDYVNELIGAAFQIRNPNATAQCGCGTGTVHTVTAQGVRNANQSVVS